MKKLVLLATFGLLLCGLAATATAEYGTWELASELAGLPPGLSNASYLGIAAANETRLYTVGLYQNSALGMQNGWRSDDGGYYYTPISGLDFSSMPNECYMWQIMNMMLAVASSGGDNVQMFGFGVNQECLDTVPFPACMFVCMMQLIPMIQYSDDGGATWEQGVVNPTTFLTTINNVDYADETVGYVVGGPNFIARTQDGGKNWNKINAPGDTQTYFNDVAFSTAEYGFVIAGDMEGDDDDDDTWAEDKSIDSWDTSAPAPDYNTMREVYNKLAHQARLAHDPIYRMESRHENPGAAKGTNGRIWRTTDGGMTWELVLSEPLQTFYLIQQLNDDELWVLGEPHIMTTNVFSLWKSSDGGTTWEDVTSRVPLPNIPSIAAFAIGAMSFQPSGVVGLLGGAGQSMLGAYKSLLYYSDDRGETWQVDSSVIDWGHPIIAFDWQSNKLGWQAGFDLSTYRYTQNNSAPVADAGPDQTVPVGTTVTLDGSGSYDPDDDPITYDWALTAGPGATLSDATAVKPTFLADAVGELTFTLTVSDGTDATSDDVLITVTGAGDDDAADDDAADDDAADDDAADDDNADDDNGDDDDDNGSCGC